LNLDFSVALTIQLRIMNTMNIIQIFAVIVIYLLIFNSSKVLPLMIPDLDFAKLSEITE